MGEGRRHRLHCNDELLQTVYDLSHYHITIISDDDDDIWTNVIKDAQTFASSRITGHTEPGYISPFEKSERPDIIYCNDSTVMGIECFKFDASKKVRGGSAQERKESQISISHIREYQQEDSDMRPLSYKTSIDPDYSMSHYTSSFLNTFNNHAEKIADYRDHIKHQFPDNEVLITFFVEDITSLGCYMRTSKGIEPVYPFRIVEILDALNKHIGSLDYIVIKYQKSPHIHNIIVQKVCDQQLDQLYKQRYGPNDTFIPYNYSVISDFV